MTQYRQELVEMREKYRDRIRVGETSEDFERNAAVMGEALREWFPIGASREEFEFVFGPPSEVRDGDLIYYFFHPFAGAGWRIKVSGGRVFGMERMTIQ